MNKIISIIAITLAIIAIVFAGLAVKKSVNVVNNIPENIPEYGALAGPDIYTSVRVHAPFTYGGKVLATTTTGTSAVMTGSDMANYDYIDLMSNTGNYTLTLPATSTMKSILSDIGGTRKWLIHHATSSGATTLTIAAGTGMDLVAVTANDDVIDPGEWAQLTCTQIYYRGVDNENIMCIVDELTNAD